MSNFEQRCNFPRKHKIRYNQSMYELKLLINKLVVEATHLRYIENENLTISVVLKVYFDIKC